MKVFYASRFLVIMFIGCQATKRLLMDNSEDIESRFHQLELTIQGLTSKVQGLTTELTGKEQIITQLQSSVIQLQNTVMQSQTTVCLILTSSSSKCSPKMTFALRV